MSRPEVSAGSVSTQTWECRRVARIVSATDAGRVLNQKLACSQIIGGAVMVIGMAMLEETVFRPHGRPLTVGSLSTAGAMAG